MRAAKLLPNGSNRLHDLSMGLKCAGTPQANQNPQTAFLAAQLRLGMTHHSRHSLDPEKPAWRIADNVGIIFGAKGGRAPEATLSRIPDAPGIYAWHNSYTHALRHKTPQDNLLELSRLVERPHCIERRARVGPAHEVSLTPKRTLNKCDQLIEALADPQFVDTLKTALDFSVFFQAPLYIGKASTSLRNRIEQHLRKKTPLAERLALAGIDLAECSVLYIQSQVQEGPPMQTPQSHQCEAETTASEPDDELLFEEVVSKLFLPTFSHRFG